MYAAKHRDDQAPTTILTVQERRDQRLYDFPDQGIQKTLSNLARMDIDPISDGLAQNSKLPEVSTKAPPVLP